MVKSSPKSRDIKCVVVGDGGVGKTSMLLAYTTGQFLAEYTPTVFDTFAVTLDINDTECNVGLYDTAGQETYDNLRSLVYYDTDIFIICFSVIRPDSWENVRTRWVPELKLYRPKCRILLVGTQIDLRDTEDSMDSTESSDTRSMFDGEFVTRKQGFRLSQKIRAVGYYECSSLTHDGLNTVFSKAVSAAIKPSRRIRLWKSFRSVINLALKTV